MVHNKNVKKKEKKKEMLNKEWLFVEI